RLRPRLRPGATSTRDGSWRRVSAPELAAINQFARDARRQAHNGAMTVRRYLAAAALAALALTACAPGGDVSDDPVVWYDWDPNGPAMLALLQGTLATKNGCLHADDMLIAIPRAL